MPQPQSVTCATQRRSFTDLIGVAVAMLIYLATGLATAQQCLPYTPFAGAFPLNVQLTGSAHFIATKPDGSIATSDEAKSADIPFGNVRDMVSLVIGPTLTDALFVKCDGSFPSQTGSVERDEGYWHQQLDLNASNGAIQIVVHATGAELHGSYCPPPNGVCLIDEGTYVQEWRYEIATGAYTFKMHIEQHTLAYYSNGDYVDGKTIIEGQRSGEVPVIGPLRIHNPLDMRLLSGALLVDDMTATNYAAPQQLAADGASAIVASFVGDCTSPARFSAPRSGGVTPFRTDYLIDLSHTNAIDRSIEAPSYEDENGCVFLALVWAPAQPFDFSNCEILITVTQAKFTSAPVPVCVVPPPLLLVHGIWSSPLEAGFIAGGFSDWISETNHYRYGFIDRVDYSRFNSKPYFSNEIQQQFGSSLARVLGSANRNGLVARQVDVFAHSMGGLISRQFISQPRGAAPPNAIHKLITIGTPHAGSALAALLLDKMDMPVQGSISGLLVRVICRVKAIDPCILRKVFEKQGHDVTDGGVAAMVPNSSLETLPLPAYHTAIAASVAFPPSGNLDTEWFLSMLIDAFAPGQSLVSILGNAHDTIVSVDSQQSIPGGNGDPRFEGIVHSKLTAYDIGETGSLDVWQAAYSALGGTPEPLRFSIPTKDRSSKSLGGYDLTAYTEDAAAAVTFEPISGSVLPANVPTEIRVYSATKSIRDVLLVSFGNQVWRDTVQISSGNPSIFTVTAAKVGLADFVAIVRFADQTYSAFPVNYLIEPVGKPFSVILTDNNFELMRVGDAVQIGAIAMYASGPVDISKLVSISPQSGTEEVIRLNSDGTVVALQPGEELLDVVFDDIIVTAYVVVVPSQAAPPMFTSASSRRQHGVAGSFDLPLSLTASTPTIEPRQGPAQNLVFTFDKNITSASAIVTEGTATIGSLTYSASTVVVPLTGVNNQQYVTVGLSSVVASDGGSGGTASVRVGFLLGDVNASRVVTLGDLAIVNGALAQAVSAANFTRDANVSGTLTLADKAVANANLTKSLPAP